MIEIIKGYRSFNIRTDMQGVKEMLEYIEGIKSKKYLQIVYLNKKRNFEIEHNDDISEMSINRESIKFYMDNDEIDYFEQRLKNSLKCNYFYPAEVCEKNYKNKNITICCEII